MITRDRDLLAPEDVFENPQAPGPGRVEDPAEAASSPAEEEVARDGGGSIAAIETADGGLLALLEPFEPEPVADQSDASSEGQGSQSGPSSGIGASSTTSAVSPMESSLTTLAPSTTADTGEPMKAAATTNGSLELSDLDGSDGFVLNGVAAGDEAGQSVSSAGDFNGDGFDDFLIAAPDATGESSRSGVVYLVYGSDAGFNASIDLSELDGSDGFQLVGAEGNDKLGQGFPGISAAGDVNNDGIDDIILGAATADDGNGEAYVIFGTDQSFGASFSVSNLDGSDGFTLIGSDGTFNGFSVSAAGDFNGDGIDDVVIGNAFASPDGRNGAGEVYVVFGSDEGFGVELSLPGLDGSDGIVFEGIESGDFTGFSVAGIGDIDGSGPGDINGDGFDDLILGAPTHNGSSGEAYVLFGSDEGFGARFDLADLASDQGITIPGLASQDFTGYSVSGAGDVDGDGFADLVVGVPTFNTASGDDAGAAYLFIGRPHTFTDKLDLENLAGKRLIRLEGGAADDIAGFSVAAAGDVNGDGFHDILIGARSANPGGREIAGETYVIFGRGDGEFPEVIDLGSLDGSDGFAISGVTAGDRSGKSVSSAGDINNDGFDDLIIGATDANADTGAAYIVYGSAEYVPGLTLFGNNEDNSLFGNAEDDVILGLRGADNLSGRGGGDILYGGFGADRLSGGGGSDTLFGAEGHDVLIGGRGADSLYGNSGGDTLDGGAGNDFLSGGTGADELFGGEGNDILNGGAGGDTMGGSVGDDTYIVGQAGDKVIESADNGSDLVKSSINYTLGDNLENLILTGNADRSGNGNGLANQITGNGGANKLNGKGGNDSLFGGGGNDDLIGGAGKDLLDGGSGNDVMTGRGGSDSFILKEGSGDDRITDFKSGQDKIDVAAYGFTSGAQVLAATSNSGGNAVIQLDNNNSVELTGVSKNQLNANDFIVEEDSGLPDRIRLPPEGDDGEALSFGDLLDEGEDLVFAGDDVSAVSNTELGSPGLLGDLDLGRVLDEDLTTGLSAV